MVACMLQESIQQDSKTDEAGEHEEMIDFHVDIRKAEETDLGIMVQEVDMDLEIETKEMNKETKETEEDYRVLLISVSCTAESANKMDTTT